MKTKYAIMITVTIALIAVVVIFWQDIKTLFSGSTKANGGTNGNADNAPLVFPLQQGSRGAEVKELQRYLNRQKAAWQAGNIIITNADLIIDGIFGAKTAAMCEAVHVSVPVTETFYNSQIKA